MDPNNTQKTKSQQETDRKLQAGQEQSDAINKGYFGNSGDSGGMIGKLASKTGVGKALGFVSRHKKGSSIGGTILTALVAITILITSLLPTQLIWMNKIFQDFNYGPHDRSVARRTVNIKRNFSRIRAGEARTRLGQKMGDITSDPARRTRVANLNNDKVSRYGRRAPFRNMVSSRRNGGFSWRFFKGVPPDSPDGRSGRNRMRGIDESRTRARANVRERQTTEDGETTTREAGDQSEIRQATEEIKENPKNSRKIARTHARRIAGPGRGSVAVAAIMIGCLSSRYESMLPDDEERYDMLLGFAGNFLASGSQLSAGEDVHGAEVGETMTAFQDEVSFENEEGETVTETRSYSDSAAWKRAVNKPRTGNESDANLSYNMELGLVSDVFRNIGARVNSIPFAGLGCSVLTNPAVGVVMTVGEGVLSILTAGGWGVVKTIASEAGFYFGVSYLLEQLAFDTVTPEDGTMQMGATDMGMNLSQSEYARSQGAPPIDNQQANAMRDEHFRYLAKEDKSRGLVWRYLTPDNPRSALTRVAMTNDFSAKGVTNTLAGLPSRLPKLIAGIFSPPAKAQEEFNNYDIQQYGFTESELSRNPIDNARYVESALRCANDNGTSDDNCTQSKTKEGEDMQKILDECIETDKEYWEIHQESNSVIGGSDLCVDPNNEERAAWSKVGAWTLDKDIADSLNCLSHDDPCRNVESENTEGGGTPSDTIPSGDGWDIEDGSDYTSTSCPQGSSEESSQYLENGIYTHPERNFKVRICRIDGKQIQVASIWMSDVVDLVNAAEQDGVSLDGAGWRSYERQAELRMINGCPDIHQSPASACVIPTAPPGDSMHEKGLAVDYFNAGGKGSNCTAPGNPRWEWLNENGAEYDSYQLSSECWHWSTNGK